MEILKKEISKDELDSGIPLGNHVLCEVYYTNRDAKTKGGVIIGFNNDVTYASEDGKDTSSHPADMAETSLVVYRCPSKLYFEPTDPKGMDWETEMELGEEDIIWTNPIDALNSVTLTCEGKEYKLINYQDVYCYKREIWVDKWSTPQKKKIVAHCINGYVLCEQVPYQTVSYLDVTSQDKIHKDRGIVRYLGTPNTRHRFPEITDFQNLEIGDLVLFDKKCVPFYLERSVYSAKFSDELFFVVPRKYINLVLERNYEK